MILCVLIGLARVDQTDRQPELRTFDQNSEDQEAGRDGEG